MWLYTRTLQWTGSEVEVAIDSAAKAVGGTALKPLQREAIRVFVTVKDVFVSASDGISDILFATRYFTWCSTVCVVLGAPLYLR